MSTIPDPDPGAWRLEIDAENKVIVVPVEYPYAVATTGEPRLTELPWSQDPEYYRARRAGMTW